MGSIDYTIRTDLGLVHFRGRGRIAYTELIGAIRGLHQDPAWSPELDCFIDFAAATIDARNGGLDDYLDFFARITAGQRLRRWAIYSRQAITVQNANMSHVFHNDAVAVDVFTQREEALAFLGITAEQLVGQGPSPGRDSA